MKDKGKDWYMNKDRIKKEDRRIGDREDIHKTNTENDRDRKRCKKKSPLLISHQKL